MNRESKRHQAREERRTEPRGTSAADVDGRRRSSPGQFLREVRSELRKVAWPGRQEVVSYTIVVLVVTVVLTSLVWGLDWLLSKAIIGLFE